MSRYRVTIDSLVDTIEASDESEAIRAVRFKHGVLNSVSQSAELVSGQEPVAPIVADVPVEEVVKEVKSVKKSRKKV
jgi:hypothetical protein